MDFYDLIKKRSSIRSYKKDPIPHQKLSSILGAARMAPSWGNKQCWRFIVVSSKVEKKLIGQASGQPNIAKACEEAPCIVVLCANIKESGVKNGMEYFLFDCGLAMENLALAAEHEGLATCIVAFFDAQAIRAILNVPEGFKVVAFTPLGIPNEQPAGKTRKKDIEVVYENVWGKPFGG